jgi:hypothetical protein
MPKNTEEVVSFTPVRDYDAENLPPEAPEGEWEFLVEKVTIRATAQEKGGFPMLQLNVTIQDTDVEKNKSFIGTKLNDFLIFVPETHKNARLFKQRVHAWMKACGLDFDLIPRKILKPADLEPLKEAIETIAVKGWTKVSVDKQTGYPRAQIVMMPPPGSLPELYEPATDEEAPVDEEEQELEEEEEEAPPPPAAKKRVKK